MRPIPTLLCAFFAAVGGGLTVHALSLPPEPSPATKIVETASRFENQPHKFIRKLEAMGFQCSNSNALDEQTGPSSKYFFNFDFVKIFIV